MSKYPNRVSVPTAMTDRTELNLSCQHITSGNFMDFMVAKRMRLVPTQSVDISHNLFARLDPLEVPTYGDSDVRTRAFFVPYRTIMPAWNDFIEDTVHNYPYNGDSEVPYSSLVPYVHRIKNSELVKAILHQDGTERETAYVTENLDTADIVLINAEGTSIGFNLTSFGSRCLKLLYSLGYALDFNLTNAEIYHNALPLLSLGKVYYDWYYQNQYISDEFGMELERLFNYDNYEVSFETYFNESRILFLFYVITKVNYDSDYFVSAWDNPVAPTSGSFSPVSVIDITSEQWSRSSAIQNSSNFGTPYIGRGDASGNTNPVIRLSQYSLDALKSLNDYAKRKQISGARVFDRYLAEFGVTLQSEALKRSIYISDHIQPVQIGDVTSTSDTEGAVLGSYAGKGITNGNGNISFETVEYGELIIISTIIPRTSYYQGADKTTYSQTRMDFWLPEFDSLGVQSLDTREVFMPLDAREQYPALASSYSPLDYNKYVFGFVPRYAELKRGVDMITGDFRLKSRGVGNDSWTLFRDLLPTFRENGIVGTKHDRVFTTGYDSDQYNRLFNVMNDEYDHFKIQHLFRIKSSFPGKSLYDDYEYKNEDKANKVVVDLHGVKAN